MRLIGYRSGKFFCAGLVCLHFALFSSGFAQPVQTAVSKQQNIDEFRKNGFAYIKAGEWDAASSAFENVLAISPKDGPSLYGKALALFNLKRITEANEKLEVLFSSIAPAKEIDPLLADSFVLSAIISAVQRQNSLAIEKLEKAIKLVPAHFDANFSLGRAYFENDEIEKSIAAFQRAISIQPNHLRCRFFLATALERKGDDAGALKEYREILKSSPNSAEGNLGLGVLLLKIEGDRSGDGLTALKKAVALDDRLYEGYIALGKTLVRLNLTSEGIENLRKAADISPNNPEPHFQLSIAYRRLGKKAEADAETEIVKKIHASRRGISDRDPR